MTLRLQGNEDLAEALIPKTFPVGCKRPTYVIGMKFSPVRRMITDSKSGPETDTWKLSFSRM